MTTVDDMDYEFRAARPEDTRAIEALDGSFTTRTIFHVAVTGDGFALEEIPVDPPVHKVFPAEDADAGSAAGEDPDSRTFVAVDPDGRLAGFAVVSYAPWNRRLTIEDIEVAPAHRGRGVGRGLVGRAVGFARERGAGHVWLEVTNVNAPAIHAYQRMGFTFCGLDTTLYDGTPSSGEHALYMSMPCSPRPAAGAGTSPGRTVGPAGDAAVRAKVTRRRTRPARESHGRRQPAPPAPGRGGPTRAAPSSRGDGHPPAPLPCAGASTGVRSAGAAQRP